MSKPGAMPRSTARGRTTDWPQVLLAACRLLEAAGDEAGPGTSLAGLGVSQAALRRQFRERLGTTPGAYLRALRLQRLVRRLNHEPDVLAAVLGAGFSSATRAYATVHRATGLPPGRLRDSPRIGWWLGLSELGWMLMATTPAGVCWLAFGDSAGELLAGLARAFPRAQWVDDSARLQGWFERVRDHLLLPEAALGLPLDIRGTAFQARVWQALRDIPLGETCSYGELAARLGQPSATRAVAAACGANRVAVLIPCHRVIGADGSATGYRWGLTRKQQLLARERDARGKPPGPTPGARSR